MVNVAALCKKTIFPVGLAQLLLDFPVKMGYIMLKVHVEIFT